MSKPLNHQRRLKALMNTTAKARNPVARTLAALGRKGGHHGNPKKQASRMACRGKVAI